MERCENESCLFKKKGAVVDGSACYQFDQHGEVRVEERVTVDDGRKRNADGDQENAVDDAKHPRKEGWMEQQGRTSWNQGRRSMLCDEKVGKRALTLQRCSRFL